MDEENASIPSPPREVRWRACLARRWLLGLLGGIVALPGLVLGLVLLLYGTRVPPLHDTWLDSEAAKARGTIVSVHHTTDLRSTPVFEFTYRFTLPGVGEQRGTSYAFGTDGSRRAAEPCIVEFLAESPQVNRIQGTSCAFYDREFATIASTCVALGLILLFLWFRGALRLRIALREGRVTSAQIIEADLVWYINPRPLRVRYRFQDGTGVERISSHLIGARTPLGRRLLTDRPREVAVIHDEVDPAVNRLVSPEYFLDGSRNA